MLLSNKYFLRLEKSLCLFRYMIIFTTFFNLEKEMYLNEVLFGRINILFICIGVWIAFIYKLGEKWGITSKRQYYLGLLEWIIDLIVIDAFAYIIGIYGDGFIYLFMFILSIIAFIRYRVSLTTLVLLIGVVMNTFWIYKGIYTHTYSLKDQNLYVVFAGLIFMSYLFYYIYQKQEKLELAITRLEQESKALKALNTSISNLYTMNTMIYQKGTVEEIITQLIKNIYKVVEETGIGVILYDENGIESNSKMYTYEDIGFKIVYAQKEIENIRECRAYKNCILNYEPIVLSNMPEGLDYTYTILPGAHQKYIYMFNLMKDNKECGLILVNVNKRLELIQCRHINEMVYHAGISLFKSHKLEMEHTKAIYDQLTGAKTRHYMEEILPHYEKRVQKNKEKLGVMFIDIDHFKQFNDKYGHATGDLVLKEVSKVIQDTFTKNSLIIRYGGEEFVVIVPGVSTGKMEESAKSLCASIAQHQLKNILPHQEQMTVSIGVAFYPYDGSHIEEVIKRADEAMYQVKQTTRNNVCLYNRVDHGGIKDENKNIGIIGTE